MAADKTILQLPPASALHVTDTGVIVQTGTTENFELQLLVDLISASVSLGSLITFGTTIPTGGKDTDVYLKTDSNQFYQKIAGTWTVIYTFPASVGTSFRYGTTIPDNTLGVNGDSYLNTLTGIFYLKTAGVYSQVFSMATGPQGPRGNSVLNGTTDPDPALGVDGDFYLNTTTFTIFGPKDISGWGSGTLLKLIPNTIRNGTINPDNSLGIDGDFYINTSTFQLFGPKVGGVWGAGTTLTLASSIPPIITPYTAGIALPIVLASFQTAYSQYGRFPKIKAVKVNGGGSFTYLTGETISTTEVSAGIPDSVSINVDDDGTGHLADNILLIISL